MDDKQATKKMFIQIVKQLRQLIVTQKIQPGDKLPSERVLSETLNVGRSSVREALRSLELLGLIETKHGGGTFLAAVQHHQLVEILSSFILQEPKSVDDVHMSRQMHEKEAIRMICDNAELQQLPVWESLFVKLELEQGLLREDILRECMIASGNRLALKIWLQLLAYSITPLKKSITSDEKVVLQMLIKSIQMGYSEEAIEAYDDWMRDLQTLT
ncbi:FadR/GntR family transcriptional regulator [Solibacillus sp. FSL H8-0538]|uniref:FadR/GntR family transcriptional regulator n=1 Tax=Solibacillus sp. FSL H8-0538 TaxID=2921400 RepID=UPI0030F8E4F0